MSDGRSDLLHRWLPIAIVVAAGVLAYADLKSDLADIRDELRPSPSANVEPTAAAGVQPPAQVTDGSMAAASAPPQTPAQDPGECSGTIAPERVRAAIGRQGPQIFRCYEERLETAPELSGTLLLRVWVDADGSVANGNVSGDLENDAQLLSCVRDAVLTWRFPPPVGGDCAIVSAPFRLAPEALD